MVVLNETLAIVIGSLSDWGDSMSEEGKVERGWHLSIYTPLYDRDQCDFCRTDLVIVAHINHKGLAKDQRLDQHEIILIRVDFNMWLSP